MMTLRPMPFCATREHGEERETGGHGSSNDGGPENWCRAEYAEEIEALYA